MGLFGKLKGFVNNFIGEEKSKKEEASDTVDKKCLEYEKLPLEGLTELVYSKDYNNADKYLVNGSSYESEFLRKAYLHNLIFFPKEKGGFGRSVSLRNNIMNSQTYYFMQESVYVYGVYERENRFSKMKLIYNKELAYYKYMPDEVFLNIPIEDVNYGYLKVSGALIDLKKVDPEMYKFAVENTFLNPKSFMYDIRFYDSAMDEKFRACWKLITTDCCQEYGLFKKDKDGNPTNEYITTDDILEFKLSRDIIDFLNYSRTIF